MGGANDRGQTSGAKRNANASTEMADLLLAMFCKDDGEAAANRLPVDVLKGPAPTDEILGDGEVGVGKLQLPALGGGGQPYRSGP